MQSKDPMEKYTVPATTQMMLGWRYDGQQKTVNPLEKFGSQARGQENVTRWFGALESFP
jgi:hypothetical protein